MDSSVPQPRGRSRPQGQRIGSQNCPLTCTLAAHPSPLIPFRPRRPAGVGPWKLAPREPRLHINERKTIFCAAQHLNSCRHTSDRILAATLDFLYRSLATLQHITTHPGTGHRDQAPGGRPTAPHLSFPTPTLLSHPNAPVGSADFKSAPAPSLTHTMVII